MHCHSQTTPIDDSKKKILLIGNPNVGKSVIFSRLTNIDVQTANYTGTTVSYHHGTVRKQGQQATLIDVPGIYSLEPISIAEQIAIDMLDKGADLIVCVLDATHLERNLHLALSLRQYNIPILYALNLCDVAMRRGQRIDTDELSIRLKAPVIETVAIKKQGINDLKEALFTDVVNEPFKIDDIHQQAKSIVDDVLKYEKVEVTLLERFGDAAMKPLTGIPIAILVLAIALGFVVGGGMAIRSLILLPLVNDVYAPLITNLVSLVVPEGTFFNILVGDYGVLIKSVEWPLALILPYVLLFYIVFSFLEDSGYLPRLGVLMDGAFKKLGLPGNTIVPFIMGYGCATPAILATRTASTEKERVIAVTLIALAIPCASQSVAFINLLASESILALIFIYVFSFFIIIVTGVLMNKIMKGRARPTIIEIPNLLMPNGHALLKKIWWRLKSYLKDAQIPMFIGILIAALLVETNALDTIGLLLEPLVEGWLGLPKEASLSLILGFIRRELAVLPLLELNLTIIQLITGSVVALFYLPCIAVIVVLFRELKFKGLVITLITPILAFLFGGIINHLLSFLFG